MRRVKRRRGAKFRHQHSQLTITDIVICYQNMRTIVDIPEELLRPLDELRTAENRSRASVIREALSEYLKNKPSCSMSEAFGLWKTRKVDSLKYQEDLRSEW